VNTGTSGDGPVSVFGSHFDSPNLNHTFSGSWFAYKGVPEQTVDLYWLWDWNTKFIAQNVTGGNRHTFGTRWLRNFPMTEGTTVTNTWHGEVEGGYQIGNDFGKNVNAGFVVAGLGHTWNQIPWEPSFWVYDDYASGSNNLKGGTTNTFAQQYGLVHAFLGQIDNIGRQNINDINGKFTVKPVKQFTAQAQYHWFDLANTGDVLYTVTGTPFGKPNTGKHVGEEFDLVGTYVFNPNFNVQVGYLWFFYGPMVENNSPRGNAEQFYVQTTFSY
jgi:Alginate export